MTLVLDLGKYSASRGDNCIILLGILPKLLEELVVKQSVVIHTYGKVTHPLFS